MSTFLLAIRLFRRSVPENGGWCSLLWLWASFAAQFRNLGERHEVALRLVEGDVPRVGVSIALMKRGVTRAFTMSSLDPAYLPEHYREWLSDLATKGSGDRARFKVHVSGAHSRWRAVLGARERQ